MSRYHSPYASPQPSSRWPWLFAALIVLALTAAGSVVLRGRLDDVGDVGSLLSSDSNEPTTAAGAAPAPTSTPAGDEAAPTTSDPGPTATTQPRPTSADPELAAAQTEETAAPEGTPTDQEQEEPADPDLESPLAVVEAYAARWGAGDYDGLYDLLGTDAQGSISRADFVARYEGIAVEAGLASVKVTVTGEPNLQSEVPIHVEYESGLVGTISEDNRVKLVKEDDLWKVAWTPSLIFRDLGDGCIDFTGESAPRGKILDRSGQPLALDAMVSEVGIIPGRIEPGKENQMLRDLGRLIDMTPEEIKARYEDGQPDWFMPVKRFPDDIDDNILNGISNLQGVAVQKATARVYPLGARAAHITGYLTEVTEEDLAEDTTGTLQPGDLIGRAGLEAAANDLLTGAPGGRLAVVHCDTRAERKMLAERQAIPAKDLILTIDINLQIAVDAAVGDVQGSAVVLDPRTGEVLALVSHPSFDPNWFVLGFSDADWAYINDAGKRPLLNRATQAGYPTGSIFKAITTAAAMHDLGYTGDTEIDCPSQFSIGSQVWNDWTVDEGIGPQGLLTLHWGLAQSCNTVFYQLGAALDEKDPELLPNMAKAFGLGAPTGIPYLQEVAGIVPDPTWKLETVGDYWATGDAVNLAIGQGYLLATPLQMAVAYAAIANGGSVLQPYIVAQTQVPGGTPEQVGEIKVRNKLPLSKAQIREIQSALRDQTSTEGIGSYRVFGDFQYPIAGKTGTAQNEENKAGKPHSWFVAFGPYGETATVTTIAMVESVGEGVSFAAPITRQIFEAYLDTDLPTE